jgi:hypothetical protein
MAIRNSSLWNQNTGGPGAPYGSTGDAPGFLRGFVTFFLGRLWAEAGFCAEPVPAEPVSVGALAEPVGSAADPTARITVAEPGATASAEPDDDEPDVDDVGVPDDASDEPVLDESFAAGARGTGAADAVVDADVRTVPAAADGDGATLVFAPDPASPSLSIHAPAPASARSINTITTIKPVRRLGAGIDTESSTAGGRRLCAGATATPFGCTCVLGLRWTLGASG